MTLTFLGFATIVFLQITAAVCVAALIAWPSRRLSAATRHAVWLSALGCAALSPAIVFSLDRLGWSLAPVPAVWLRSSIAPSTISESSALETGTTHPSAEPEAVQFMPTGLIANPAESAPQITAPPDLDASADSQSPPPPTIWIWGTLSRWLLVVWGAGVLIGLARILMGWLWLRRLRRSLRPFDTASESVRRLLDEVRNALGIRNPPPIYVASQIEGPLAIGVLRPCVVIPEALLHTDSRHQLRDVLIHECAHVARHDPLIGWIQRIAAALYWPHPLLHWLNRQLSRCREEICDNFVIRQGDPCGYARTLLDLSSFLKPSNAWGVGVGFLSARWTLRDRIAGILDPRRDVVTQPKPWTVRLAAIVLIFICTAAGAVRPADPTDQATEPSLADERIIQGVVVDEQGRPIAQASVTIVDSEKTAKPATTALDGSFRLAIRGRWLPRELLLATAENGRLMGLGKHLEPLSSKPAETTRIVVKPSRSTVVHVKDADDQPVPGAVVAAIGYDCEVRSVSDANGVATLRTPVDAKLLAGVAGLKSMVGFDYFESPQSHSESEFDPLPDEIHLRLNGVRPIRFKTVDRTGKPVPRVLIRADRIMKSGKAWPIILSESQLTEVRSDDQGIAAIDWLPVDLEKAAQFKLASHGYSTDRPIVREPGVKAADAVIEVQLIRDVNISGRVRTSDGQPAAGVMVHAEGRGPRFSLDHQLTRTREDGTYSFAVHPESTYMIGVSDNNKAARSLSGVVVREDKPLSGLDFTLIEGTVIRGQALRIRDGKPASGQRVFLKEQGRKIVQEFSPPPIGREWSETLTRGTETDAEGRYRFLVGPGRYSLEPGEAEFAVTTEAEIVKALRITDGNYHKLAAISGDAIETTATGDRAIPNAILDIANLDDGGRNRAIADNQGRFRFLAPANSNCVVYVRDPAGRVAGVAVISTAAAQSIRLLAKPASKIVGKVMDTADKPVSGHHVQIRIDSDPGSEHAGRFRASTRTDADGRYEFSGIPVDAPLEIYASYNRDETHWVTNYVAGERLKAATPEPTTVPDLLIPSVEDAAKGPIAPVTRKKAPAWAISKPEPASNRE